MFVYFLFICFCIYQFNIKELFSMHLVSPVPGQPPRIGRKSSAKTFWVHASLESSGSHPNFPGITGSDINFLI